MIGEGDEVISTESGSDRVSIYAIVDCRNYDPVATALSTDSVIKAQNKRTMKRARLMWAVLALMAFTSYPSQSQTKSSPLDLSNIRMPLLTGWQFREAGKDKWYPASVPGCVHTDLLNNKLIDDPFYRDNEKKLQWIGKTDWEYQTTFKLTAEVLKRANLELVFEGLDTYSNVFLNDQLLKATDNMFRMWRVNFKRLAKPGANTLRIRFRSPINEVLPVMARMNYELPAANDQGEKTSPHTRKAPYQYGWDWGPRFVTSGIWHAVFLEAWDKARVADLHLVPREIRTDVANLTAEIEVVAGATRLPVYARDVVTTGFAATARLAARLPQRARRRRWFLFWSRP